MADQPQPLDGRVSLDLSNPQKGIVRSVSFADDALDDIVSAFDVVRGVNGFMPDPTCIVQFKSSNTTR